jgi:hypothetical protein
VRRCGGEGDGNFYLGIQNISKDKLKVEPRLEVGLHPIDQHILTSLNKNFHEIGKINQCGNYPH